MDKHPALTRFTSFTLSVFRREDTRMHHGPFSVEPDVDYDGSTVTIASSMASNTRSASANVTVYGVMT